MRKLRQEDFVTCLGYGHELVAGSPGPGLPPALPPQGHFTCLWALTVCVPQETAARGIGYPVSLLVGTGPSRHICRSDMSFLGPRAGFRGCKDEQVVALLSTGARGVTVAGRCEQEPRSADTGGQLQGPEVAPLGRCSWED